MRYIFTTILCILLSITSFSQAVYTSANYNSIGDTAFLTEVRIDSTNYLASGPGHVWNFDTLKGVSQQQLIFRNPKNTGYSQLQWNYIYKTDNVNISTTNGLTTALGPFTISNQNDYYLNGTSSYLQKASAYNLAYNSLSFSIKNTYTTPDTVYKFPLHYSDTCASFATYTTTIPGLYYNTATINRTNKVDGWGTITTPYGKFTNCLRVVSNVNMVDSFAITGIGIPTITSQYRELKWLDTTKGYPVLLVKQTKVGNAYVTQSVQYLDTQKYFQPKALFAFVPLQPSVSDTIIFQNLSTNASTYLWNFGDNSSSTEINPQHQFKALGTYTVSVIAYNGSLTDTFRLNINVTNQPLALFTYLPIAPVVNDTISFQNLSNNGVTYLWNFGDGSSTSTLKNPTHVYTATGNYYVKLIVYNGSLTDSIIEPLFVTTILPLRIQSFTATHNESSNLLQWSTISESNTATFEVERSDDGINFKLLQKAAAIGSGNNAYQFSDAGKTTYNSVYYRLKIVDKDGATTYSNILNVQSLKLTTERVHVFPNPVLKGQYCQMRYHAESSSSINFCLADATGKVLLVQNQSVQAGDNTVTVNTSQFNKGTYFIKCINSLGQAVGTSTIIIQ